MGVVTTEEIYKQIFKIFGFEEKDLIKSINIRIECNSIISVEVEKYLKKEESEELITFLEKYRLIKDDNQQPTA